MLNLDNSDNRRVVEHCFRTTSTLINPIIEWTDDDVWEFLNHYGCKSNPLYQCGYERIGCVGCPLGGYKSMKREFQHYPKYKQLYIHAFEKMLEKRLEKNLPTEWRNGEEVFHWWINVDGNQLTFSGFDISEL